MMANVEEDQEHILVVIIEIEIVIIQIIKIIED